ncbi:MAG: HEAT repeat domain-containing protein [Acidobacteriota bacterium]
MKNRLAFSGIAILILIGQLFAQGLPPTLPPQQKPSLKRDRTLQLVLPKIIQAEDERQANSKELVDLVSPLNANNGAARRRAILALGRIGYPSYINSLTEVLKIDRNPELRALAAFSLGEIESHYAVSSLFDRLNPEVEDSALVRARAAEALGKIASNKLSAEALGKYGLVGIAETLVKLLPDPAQPVSPDSKMIASLTLTALLRIRQASTIPAIINQLRSTDADLRWQAANALARIRENIAPAVPNLIPLLEDRDALVRAQAARALGVAKDAKAVEPLIKLLTDKDERVVASAINALGAIGDAKAVEPLINSGNKWLAGFRAFDRAKGGVPSEQNLLLLVATALGNLKDAKALPFLNAFRLAVDNHIGSSPEVEIALAKFGEAAFFDFPESAKIQIANWKAVANFAQGLGELRTEKAKATLIDLFAAKPDARAISDILNALAATKLDGLQKILLDQLKTPDVVARATVANLLGDAGEASDTVITALNEAYKTAKADKANDARIAIVEALTKLKKPMNIQALAEETKDDDYVVRRRAAELLIESKQDVSGLKLSIGTVKTGHDRAYWKRLAQLTSSGKNPIAILHTTKGDVRIELKPADAPITVDNFLQLAKSGFFNGLAWIRVVPNFVIQGGDPRGDQNGGPDYQIRDEINLLEYKTGAVGMALSGKDTGGSQFFITHSPQPHLDGGYTIFGQVTAGMEVVGRIARGDKIERVEIIER